MALDRYQFTKTQQDRYRITRYPKFPKQESDLYIISREGDRLDLLANEFYEDPRYWWVLAEANPKLGKGTFDVPPGVQLRIPYPLVDVGVKLQKAQKDR